MSLAGGSDGFPRQFYFSLDVYVRGADGTLKLGNLAPGSVHVSALPIAPADFNQLYVGDRHPLGVRCARFTAVTPWSSCSSRAFALVFATASRFSQQHQRGQAGA